MNPSAKKDEAVSGCQGARILITRTDRIGDLVLSTPVFKAVREKFPDAWIACLTFCENRELVEGNPYLDEVILYDKKGPEHGVWGNLLFAGKIRTKKFDVVIHLHSTNRMHWMGWLAGIPCRIGWKRKSAWTLTRAYPDQKKFGQKHEAEYNFDLLESIGIHCPPVLETFLPRSERAKRSFALLVDRLKISRNKPWIVLHPGASCPSKRWPAERFGELIDRLADQYDAEYILIGQSTDRELMARVKRAATRPLRDLSGQVSLGALGILLKDAALLISNDSGPVHMASAVGTPVVSIFGRKQAGLSPERWRPLGQAARTVWKDVGCRVCLAHRCQIHFLCLDAILVDEVLREANTLLSAGRNPGDTGFKQKRFISSGAGT